MYNSFEQWFFQTIGYGAREESFWEAVRYGDDEVAYKFLRQAWRLGYEAGRRAEGPMKNCDSAESEAPSSR